MLHGQMWHGQMLHGQMLHGQILHGKSGPGPLVNSQGWLHKLEIFFRIFLAFVPNVPMTIRFILVPLEMFVCIWKTLHADPILREQPNLNHNKDEINFYFVLFFYFIIEI